jgi:hypothetical protein
MSKRKRFVITSALLSLGFIGIQVLEDRYKFIAIGSLSLLTLILFFWSLREGLGKNMSLLSLVLPTIFTFGVGFFWFLLPSNLFTRLPIIIFYGLGIYILCLTSNIYTVATIRTIALLRAARGVGFVLTLLTSFLIYDTILSLKEPFYITSLLVMIASFPLFYQGLWSTPLEPFFEKNVLILSLVFSLIVGEIVIGLYFWPVTVVVGSLFLTLAVYTLLGLGQAKLESRLFPQTTREYLMVGILVFLGMIFATHWGA